jgi:hypothetical protein
MNLRSGGQLPSADASASLQMIFVVAAAALAVLAAGWFLVMDEEPDRARQDSPPVRVPASPLPVEPTFSTSITPIPSKHKTSRSISTPAGRPAAAATSHSVGQLEQQFRATNSTKEQLEIVREIAGLNNPEAVMAIARLFAIARHPEVKTGLLSGLGDIDTEAAPAVRLSVLTQALQGEARNVRSAALDLLDDLQDAGALPLMRRVMMTDPDEEIREAAAAMYQSRTEKPDR